MRICPNCSTQINNPDAFFCFNCGSKIVKEGGSDEENKDYLTSLGDSSSNHEGQVPIPPIREEKNTGANSWKWNYFIVGINVVSMLFLVFSLGLFLRTNQTLSDSTLTPVFEISNIEIENTEEVFQAGDLNTEIFKTDYSSIVPQDSVLYIESSNIDTFFDNLLTEEQAQYLSDTYEMNLEDLLVFMKKDFAYVRHNSEDWAVITRAGGLDFFDRTFSTYQENKVQDAPIYTSRVGEFLVFSENPDLINSFNNVGNNIELGLVKDANFLRVKDSVDGVPVFFLYSPSKDYVDSHLENDLNLFNLEFVLEDYGRPENKGFAVLKEVNGYSLKFL